MPHWTATEENGGKDGAVVRAVVAVGHKVYSFTESRNYRMDQNGNWVWKGSESPCVFNTVTLRWQKLPPVKGGEGLNFYSNTAVLVEYTIYIWGSVGSQCDELHAFVQVA